MTITAVLLAHYPERKENIKRIVDDLRAGSLAPDEIIVFVDNPDFDTSEFSDVRVIESNTPFPVSARMHAASFASSSHVFMIDCDLTVERGTLEHLAEYSKQKPYSVLGFEGSTLRDTPTPYTDGISIEKSDELQLADMIIRCYFMPKAIIGLSIYMHELDRETLGDKYNDDILMCMSNRLMQKHSNWIVPHEEGKNIVELGNSGVGQSLEPQHYETRNKNCRYLIDKYQATLV
jgi:glycosyltransferase involved in cell wall biosynthesis